MLPHSNDLLQYYLQTSRGVGQFIRIEVYIGSTVVYEFDDDSIISGSVSIDKKSVSKSSFSIGEVYIGEAKFSVLNSVVNVNTEITGSRVKIYTGAVLNGVREEFQIFEGIIQSNSVTRKIASTDIVVDGVLALFDDYIGNLSTSGTSYDLVHMCCDLCGVELAMTKVEFEALSVNTAFTLFITAETAIKTYRDILMFVAQLMGCFVDETTDGRIVYKKYLASNDSFNMNLDTISSSKFGERSIHIDGMTWVRAGTAIYIAGSASSLYLLELEENPLLAQLTNDVFQVIAQNLYTYVVTLDLRYAGVEYNGCPLVELGDKLIIAEKGISSFITSIKWTYHGKSSLESVDIDKRVNTEQQSVKGAAASGGGGGDGGMSIIRYINVKDIDIGMAWQTVAITYFSCPGGVSPYMDICATINVPVDGLVEARIVYNNVETLMKYKWNLRAGFFTIAFSKSFDPAEQERSHSLEVQFKFGTAGSKVRLSQYDLEMNILAYKAVSGTPEWTGLYELTDEVPVFRTRGGFRMLGVVDSGPSVTFDNA